MQNQVALQYVIFGVLSLISDRNSCRHDSDTPSPHPPPYLTEGNELSVAQFASGVVIEVMSQAAVLTLTKTVLADPVQAANLLGTKHNHYLPTRTSDSLCPAEGGQFNIHLSFL